jgi:hypothetical protein
MHESTGRRAMRVGASTSGAIAGNEALKLAVFGPSVVRCCEY